MAKKQFQAESKRLLDLMIHSIYTNKEIFLRELISNASDAVDKRYFQASAAGETGLNRADFPIRVTPDEAARTLTVSDPGIGMTAEELEDNLGVIAQSGSFDFKTTNAEADGTDALDIIGQFGVGFYSAFMVADKITVRSRVDGADTAYEWMSEGVDGYTVEPCDKATSGTDVILHLLPDTEDEHYSDYLTEWRLRELIKRYSDYIRYPIVMNVEKRELIEATEEERQAEDYEPKYNVTHEDETINSMVPIWKKNRGEVTDEEYNQFYKDKFFDFADPQKVITTSVEGMLSYQALLFIPSQVPYNFYSRDYKRGLQLYSSGVLIMDKCEDLLPEYFGFVRGLVDSQDLSLNISREMLQQDRQLKAIANRLEKKITSELKTMLDKDREAYETFYRNFGLRLKFGVYDNFGTNKDKLCDLIMFESSAEGKLTTFREYVDRMKDDQTNIYYATGENADKIRNMPQMELLADRGYEVLFCTEEVDEFALKVMGDYDGKPFKSVADDDLGIAMTDEQQKAMAEKTEAAKDVISALKDALGDKVSDVKLSPRLKNHPVCFSTEEGVSLEMEKVMAEQARALGQDADDMLKAKKVLEVNGDHVMFEGLSRAVAAGETDTVKSYADLLYNLAMLIEGMPIEDPVTFSNSVCGLMV